MADKKQSKDNKSDYGLFTSQIQFADECAKNLRETANKTSYKDAMLSFFPNDAYVESMLDCQQTILNNTLSYSASNTETYADYLKALSKAD